LGRLVPFGKGELAQHAAVDLDYDAAGVAATFQGKDGKSWAGWLPRLDLNVSRALTQASTRHTALWSLLDTPGELTLRTQLDLWQMLRPAVQPGSKLDHTWPPEEVTLEWTCNQPLKIQHGDRTLPTDGPDKDDRYRVRLTLQVPKDQPVPLMLSVTTGTAVPRLSVSYHTAEDARPRALALHRSLVPWATKQRLPEEVAKPRAIPQLQGGDWARGKAVFFSAEA